MRKPAGGPRYGASHRRPTAGDRARESVCLERSHLLPWTPELETFGPTPESNHAHGLRADSNGTHARSVNVAVRYGHARCEQPCTCCEQGTVRQDFSPPPTKGSEAGRWRRKHAASVLSLISEQATTHAAIARARGCDLAVASAASARARYDSGGRRGCC